jgi:hypothetical protein
MSNPVEDHFKLNDNERHLIPNYFRISCLPIKHLKNQSSRTTTITKPFSPYSQASCGSLQMKPTRQEKSIEYSKNQCSINTEFTLKPMCKFQNYTATLTYYKNQLSVPVAKNYKVFLFVCKNLQICQ